jgi:AcrR family transcriptional regulator
VQTPKRGRGRPPNTPAAIERRRTEIIEAAYEVFADKGYHAAGIADIAARLEIGHGTFYRYFDNKRDILDHVVDYGVGRVLAMVVPDDLTEATTREELREQLTTLGTRIFTEVVDRDPRLPRMILFEVTAIDAELLQRVLGLLETVGALVSPLLQNGVRRGFLRADLDVDSAARALTGCVIAGLFALVRNSMSKKERARYIDTVVSMICDNVDPAETAPAQSVRGRAKKSASS